MASDIEDLIEDLEEYIDGCKPSAFSSSKITVNRDDIEGIISELKTKIPSELSRSKKIISNQQAILDDAKRQAKDIINSAKIRTNELVSEHQIMQQAYAQANEVVLIATKEAQNSIDSATRDANEIRSSAIEYTDNLLRGIQEVLNNSIKTTRDNQQAFLNTMQGYLDIVNENRYQLAPNPIAEEIMHSTPEIPAAIKENKSEEKPEDKEQSKDSEENSSEPQEKKKESAIVATGVIDIPEQFFKKD